MSVIGANLIPPEISITDFGGMIAFLTFFTITLISSGDLKGGRSWEREL